MNTQANNELKRLKKGLGVPVPKSTSGFTIDVDDIDVDVEDIIYSLSNIVDGQKQIKKIHQSAEKMLAQTKRRAQQVKIDTAKMLDLINEQKIDDAIDHIQQINTLCEALNNYVHYFGHMSHDLKNVNLSIIDETAESVSNDIDLWQESLIGSLAHVMRQAELTHTAKKRINGGDVAEFCSNCFEDWRGDCDQFGAEIQEIFAETTSICNKALRESLDCCYTFDLNAERVRKMQMEKLVEQSLASSEVCAHYHRQCPTIINDTLLASSGNKMVFGNNMREFLSGYKSAYEKHRKQNSSTAEALAIMENAVKRGNFFVEASKLEPTEDKGKNRNKNKAKAMTDEQKAELGAIADTKKQIESIDRRVRSDYREDSSKVQTRADAVAVSLQAGQ